MSSKVEKWLCVPAVVVGLTIMLPAKSLAGTDLGQFCWTVVGFSDVIRCSVTALDGPEPMFGLYCSDQDPGNYQVLGAGLARRGLLSADTTQLTFVGAHDTVFFLGNQTCAFSAQLDSATLNGPLIIECAGGSTSQKFTFSGTMAFLPTCSALSDLARGGRRGLGR